MAEQRVDLVKDLIKPTPRQREFMRAVVRHRYVLFGGAAGGGKALALDTPIMTPDGFKPMGDIVIGDRVYAPDGMPVLVVDCTEVQHGRPCYRVVFDDGAEIVADAEHLWKTFDIDDRAALTRLDDGWRERRRAKRKGRGKGKRPDLADANRKKEWVYKELPTGTLRTTREIAETLMRGVRHNHSVPLAEALVGRHTDLPIPPYTLGAWLGDGTSTGGCITSADDEVVGRIRADGYEVKKLKQVYLYGIRGLRAPLKELGVFANKHIPGQYLTASHEQRIELLRGLMDTDGCAGEDGRCEFTGVNRRLAEDTLSLALSLGLKATLRTGVAKLNGVDCGPKYRVTFTAHFPVFNLKRKAERQNGRNRSTTRNRYIVSCEPCESVPVKCITVDREDGMYLAGRELIPTHNSFSLRWTLVWLLTRWAAKGHRNVRVGLFCEDYPALKERHLSKVEIEFPDWLGKMRSADHEYKLNPEYGGGVIAFRNLDDPSKYLSSEFAAIAVDELTKNDLNTFSFLRMRLRWPEIEDTRFMAATNPGGKGHCVPYGDVLTPNGWVDIKSLAVGDPVYGVAGDGSLVESRVGQVHAHPYVGPLWTAEARGLHIACTPGHRIAKSNGVRLGPGGKFSLVKAEDLPGQTTVLRGVKFAGDGLESFTVPAYKQRRLKLDQPDTITGDHYAQLMGWFLSEGCVVDRDKAFAITQCKQGNLPAIESMLKGCGFSYKPNGKGYTVYSGKWWSYLRRFGKCRDKYVPRELLNASPGQLRLFLESAMAGDGHWASEDSGQYYTLSKRLADDMCEVLVKLGFTVSVNARQRANRNGLSYTINFRCGEFQEILTGQHVYDVQTECVKPKNVRHEPFDGMVYDIGVPEHHAFVIRQNGSVWVSGNSWVKGFWMDRSFPEEMEHIKGDFVFIPAKASDNPHLAESYVDGLRSLPEHLRKAYLDGSWDIFEGQVFGEWDSSRHIEDDPVIDPSWMRFRSMDWGFSKPYAIYWHAVDPDGCIHTYRELYGCREGMPDTGTQETADEVAKKVSRLEKGEAISYGVADPAIWSKTGTGPSIAEEFTRNGVHWMPADNSRLAGWDQMHKRLRDGSWKISRSCRGLIRTLPVLTYDPFKAEDVNTREEDHPADSARYGLMTRPWTPYVEPERKRRDRWAKVEREGAKADSWMAV